jgi:hypothetical protein
MAFYLFSDGVIPVICCSSPYNPDTTIWRKAKSKCSDSLPSYEVKMLRSACDPFEMGSFQTSIGSADIDTASIDTGYNEFFVGIGAEYKGSKSDWNSHPYDNPRYYPTFNISSTTGPYIACEKTHDTLHSSEEDFFGNFPSPCNPGTTIQYFAPHSKSGKSYVSIKLFTLNGSLVRTIVSTTLNTGTHNTYFDGRSAEGHLLNSGLYICRLETAKCSKTIKIIISK